MSEISALKDAAFLKKLDAENIKVYYTKIIVLDKKEIPIRSIEGRVSGGSISIDGNSSVRRSGSITFVAEEDKNDLSDIDNLLALNKKIKILIGIENNIDKFYENIIWFNQGIFIITQPAFSHTLNGVSISLSFKDKMCLLNGDCGGNLPTSIVFHEYDQTIGYQEIEYIESLDLPQNPNDYTIYGFINKNDKTKSVKYMAYSVGAWIPATQNDIGQIITRKQRIFDIILTLVANYGNEDISKIIINDIKLEIKNSVRYVGESTLWYNPENSIYTLDEDVVANESSSWIPFNYNEDCGYIYTDFTYPGELISSIGDNVCSVLDKIKDALGNYEYFYDINGNFVFQEIKNYLNTSYSPVKTIIGDYLLSNTGSLLREDNYQVDFNNYTESLYSFDKNSNLITSYSNSPNYLNIKNDFHIWGKNQSGLAIHYHVVIKEKPYIFTPRYVVYEKDDNDNYTGKVRLATTDEIDPIKHPHRSPGVPTIDNENETLSNLIEDISAHINENNENLIFERDTIPVQSETLILDDPNKVELYTPTDWRAELYLQGLENLQQQRRPDIYQQELLDLFDSIYNMKEKCFKINADRPNDLLYWLDFIDPVNELKDISVDVIGSRIHSYQQDKINKLYTAEIPNTIMIDIGSSYTERAKLIERCEDEGQPYANVSSVVYKNVALGTVGYSAQEVARDLLYQYTNFLSAININCAPIYYLDTNTRITVQDKQSNIYGDYIIKSINLPLDAKNTMSFTATRALERI